MLAVKHSTQADQTQRKGKTENTIQNICSLDCDGTSITMIKRLRELEKQIHSEKAQSAYKLSKQEIYTSPN